MAVQRWAMSVQRFRVQITADPRGHAVVAVPFDPDKAWGAKAVHHVAGTVNGCRVRVTLAPGDGGWAFTLNPSARYIDATTRRPDLRAARIAEVVGLLADGTKERPRPSAS